METQNETLKPQNDLSKLAETILSLSITQILEIFIHSLRKPRTDKVEMSKWYTENEGVCYGCAATNLICELGNLNPREVFYKHPFSEITPTTLYYPYYRDLDLIAYFEDAINDLRWGNLASYNAILCDTDIAKFPEEIVSIHTDAVPLPLIETLNGVVDEESLKPYEELLELLKSLNY